MALHRVISMAHERGRARCATSSGRDCVLKPARDPELEEYAVRRPLLCASERAVQQPVPADGAGAPPLNLSVRRQVTLMEKTTALAGLVPLAVASLAATPLAESNRGGDHVVVRFSETGGSIEWDCGSAEIGGPIELDERGRFTAEGRRSPGFGGPAIYPVPEARKPRRVKYRGWTDGKRMRLVIIRVGLLWPPEPRKVVLKLERDRPVRLVKCR